MTPNPRKDPSTHFECEMSGPPCAFRLDGQRALITGGGSGIGAAVAIAFAREGADVGLSYLPEEQVDAEVKELIRTVGPGGGYIITSGNSLASFLKLENVLAMAAAVAMFWPIWFHSA